MIYIAINNKLDDDATYYKTTTLHRALEFINTNNHTSFTISDMEFFDIVDQKDRFISDIAKNGITGDLNSYKIDAGLVLTDVQESYVLDEDYKLIE